MNQRLALGRDVAMQIGMLNLDGCYLNQRQLTLRCSAGILPMQHWGPRLRMACSFRRFGRFERELEAALVNVGAVQPSVLFCGSGDFHHVSLALVRRLQTPFNLLVLDNHPDWMRGVPFLHCGTWLYHAAKLPLLGRIFHLGGEVDFDNYYQWMAPWSLLRSGKITVFPGHRRFQRGDWAQVPTEPLRIETELPVTSERVEKLLLPFRDELASRPLYISLDKDVLTAEQAVVNWDSGRFTLPEVLSILNTVRKFCTRGLAGMDIVGDWSPVRVQGTLRRLIHWTEHPSLCVHPNLAAHCNELTNLAILQQLALEEQDLATRCPAEISPSISQQPGSCCLTAK
jgi:hypothetical protein